MEQSKLFLAIALSFIVFFVWNFFFTDHEKVQQRQVLELKQTTQKKQNTDEIEPIAIETESLDIKNIYQKKQNYKTISVKSPYYNIKISEKGAVFDSVKLNYYREGVNLDSPLKELIPKDKNNTVVRLSFAKNTILGLNDAIFSTNLENDTVNIYDKSKEISFVWASPQGVVIEKKYLFSPETYLIGLTIKIKNASDKTIQDRLILSLAKPYSKQNGSYGFEGPSTLLNNKLKQIKIKKIKDKNLYSGNLGWVAVQDRYFMSSIIPDKPGEASLRLLLNQNNMLEAQYELPESIIISGSQHNYDFYLFLGPKSMKVLSSLNCDLDKAINFGMFDFIAKPCLWFMNFLYNNLIPNYGIAIIILTVITKLILWPLGTKSYKSMSEMKKIQPLMTEIKSKYKNDKKKMNEEMIGLYKTYKVNPMSGCLPMVVQIPVFFALYRMLYEAIELRHAPFFGWINDLAAPDRLFNFTFSIPFMQPPYGIPVLTIVMGATMFLQQKMSPPMGDPTQAKMMMLMPVVFTVIFINFSSGLVLYWLINNILSISQQYYIAKKTA